MFGWLGNSSNPSKKRHHIHERQEGEWFGVSFSPQNFLPGLIIGFLFGLFLDLTKIPKNSSKSNKLIMPNPSKRRHQRQSTPSSDEEIKMVLVVRQDLKMGVGKIASQCAHAATGMYSEMMQSQRSVLSHWEQCGQPKIVVSCKNQQEMNRLKQAAESIGLPTFVVADAGRTQVLAGSKTVLAVGPVGLVGYLSEVCADFTWALQQTVPISEIKGIYWLLVGARVFHTSYGLGPGSRVRVVRGVGLFYLNWLPDNMG